MYFPDEECLGRLPDERWRRSRALVADVIRAGTAEGKQLEFKRDLSSPLPVVRTLVAFANTVAPGSQIARVVLLRFVTAAVFGAEVQARV